MRSVFVPTKNRAGASSTIENLRAEKIPHFIVVEPQEKSKYHEAYPNSVFLVLPENDKGLPFSRNNILSFAREIGLDCIWMLDDDIKMMGKVVDQKTVKTSWTAAMNSAEELFLPISNLGVGAMEYQQFAWSHTRAEIFNSYCDTCVFINIANTMRCEYRPGFKHDRDMVLQCLQRGFVSMRTGQICFGTPKNGSNKGGLFDEYAAGKESQSSAEMVRRWPGICTLHTKKDGRPDVKVNWKLFKDLKPQRF